MTSRHPSASDRIVGSDPFQFGDEEAVDPATLGPHRGQDAQPAFRRQRLDRSSHRRRIGGRIDLDHHLMPDPVGEAISELLDRIDFLEMRLAHREGREPTCEEDIHEPA